MISISSFDAMEMARGLKSDIIKLRQKENHNPKWTIWYRLVKSTKNVIYSGFKLYLRKNEHIFIFVI